MKLVKIVLILFVVFFVVFIVGLGVFLRTFRIDRYRPQITAELQKALGRPVGLGPLAATFTLSGGFSFQIDGLSIKDAPAAGDRKFFSLKQARLDIDLGQLLIRREVAVTRVELLAPEIFLVKSADGTLNLPVPATGVNSGDAPRQQPQADPVAAAAAPALPFSLRISTFKIRDGVVRFLDETMMKNAAIVDRINLNIQNVSLDGQAFFDLSVAFAQTAPNIFGSGKFAIDLEKSQVIISDLSLQTDLSKFSLEKLAAELPPQVDISSITRLEGQAKLLGPQIVVGAAGLSQAVFRGELTGGYVQVKSLSVPIQGISLKFEGSQNNIHVSRISGHIGSGTFNGQAAVQDYLQRPHYTFQMKIDGVQLGEVYSPPAEGVAIQGGVVVGFSGEGHLSEEGDPLTMLTVDGNYQLSQLTLMRMNLLRMVLDRISVIPGLYSKVYESLSADQKAKLEQDYTLFQNCFGNLAVRDRKMDFDSIKVMSDAVGVNAKAAIDSKLNLSYQGEVLIPKVLAAAIVQKVPELNGLLNTDGDIGIPLRPFSGQVTSFSVMPDLKIITERVAVTEGRRQLDRLIDKTFGGSSEKTGGSPADGESQQPVLSPEGQIIKGVLDRILR